MSCHFCKEVDEKKIPLPQIGIGFGMSGEDMDFCKKCLKSMSAYEFWERLAKEQGYGFPLIPLPRHE